VQKVIDECPLVEHLVLWMSTNLDIIHSLSHPKLMWMDLWLEISSIMKSVENIAQMRTPGLPVLRRMRIFDNRLWHPRATDLPALLPPAVEGNGIEYTYFGLNIKQSGHLVFQTDQTTNFIFGTSSDEEDEQSDFDPGTIPSYDDTSEGWGSSCDDDSSFGNTDGVLDIHEELQEWEPNPHKALAVFSSNLEF
jgi:hypothetical protein